jgi:ACT domain-containing protein
MGCISANQGDAVSVVDKRGELRDVANIMASCKIYVLALSVVGELAEHCTNFEVGVLFQLSSVDEIEEVVGSIEAGDKWSQRALVGST